MALDPVMHALSYFKLAGISPKSDQYIFCGLRDGVIGIAALYVPRMCQHVSHTTMRDLLKKAIGYVGLNPRNFGTHSLRAGDATAAPDKMLLNV